MASFRGQIDSDRSLLSIEIIVVATLIEALLTFWFRLSNPEAIWAFLRLNPNDVST